MKQYRVVDNVGNLEHSLNDAAREGFRPLLMAADGAGLVTVLMERDMSDTRINPERT